MGTSLSRSLRGMPNWLLRDNKSPSELQPAGREDRVSDEFSITVTRVISYDGMQFFHMNMMLGTDLARADSII